MSLGVWGGSSLDDPTQGRFLVKGMEKIAEKLWWAQGGAGERGVKSKGTRPGGANG